MIAYTLATSLTDRQLDRFWSKVQENGPDQCWPWIGVRDKDGYGLFKANGMMMRAHVLALYLSTGDFSSLWTLHSCDSPPCCNPFHLRLGTATENVADKIRRGRLPKVDRSLLSARQRGSLNGNAKLTEEQVASVREMYQNGCWTQQELADEFEVCANTIWNIINRASWASVN